MRSLSADGLGFISVGSMKLWIAMDPYRPVCGGSGAAVLRDPTAVIAEADVSLCVTERLPGAYA